MKKWDVIVVIIALIVAGGLYFSGFLRPQEEGGQAVVYVEGKEVERLNLNTNSEVRIETAHGFNVVSVIDGQAVVSEADCPDKICMNHAPVSLVKESITCLPHKLIVEIENTKESEIDAVAQ